MLDDFLDARSTGLLVFSSSVTACLYCTGEGLPDRLPYYSCGPRAALKCLKSLYFCRAAAAGGFVPISVFPLVFQHSKYCFDSLQPVRIVFCGAATVILHAFSHNTPMASMYAALRIILLMVVVDEIHGGGGDRSY